MGLNNPSDELIKESELQWNGEKVMALVSIGAGYEGVIHAADSSSSNELNSTLMRMATDCERVATCLEDRFRGKNIYFRLNVEQGFQLRTEGTRTMLEDIEPHTKAYLQTTKISILIDELVVSLVEDLEAPDYTSSSDYFRQIMDRYITDCNQILAEIRSDDARSVMNVVVTLLESVQVSRLVAGLHLTELDYHRALPRASHNGFLSQRSSTITLDVSFGS